MLSSSVSSRPAGSQVRRIKKSFEIAFRMKASLPDIHDDNHVVGQIRLVYLWSSTFSRMCFTSSFRPRVMHSRPSRHDGCSFSRRKLTSQWTPATLCRQKHKKTSHAFPGPGAPGLGTAARRTARTYVALLRSSFLVSPGLGIVQELQVVDA